MSGSWKDIPIDDVRNILIGLIGKDFGDKPEERIDDIRESRKGYASLFTKMVDLDKNDVVIDLGSGCGFGTYWLSEAAKRVIACDISDAYLRFAENQCADRENIEFKKIENACLDFLPDESIDKIISMSVFIHMNVYDMYYYFEEFVRVLKPGGRVCIDLADGDTLNFSEPGTKEKWFLDAAKIYDNKTSHLSGLMNWNSARTVENIAKAHGLNLFNKHNDIILFKKQ